MPTFIVDNVNDAGPGSLRAAINGANADISATQPVIGFSVSGTITLATDLPKITRAVTIDATAAPTHTSGGAPVVELNCDGNAGLTFAAGSDGSQLLGAAICNANGNGVTLDAGSVSGAHHYFGFY